jgi:methylglutaconyl-CoA hydratase
MFLALDRLPVPLIGRIHGAALGGGSGLAAICDVVVAADDVVFGFTEVVLGILPAMISPYVVRKIGLSAARELCLSGTRFSAARAKEIGSSIPWSRPPSSTRPCGSSDAVRKAARRRSPAPSGC